MATDRRFDFIGYCRTGWEILQAATDNPPDLVLTDFKLDDMTGAALAKALKGRTKLPVVIVLSIHNRKEFVEISMRAGADGYVLKKELQRVAEVLRRAQIASP